MQTLLLTASSFSVGQTCSRRSQSKETEPKINRTQSGAPNETSIVQKHLNNSIVRRILVFKR